MIVRVCACGKTHRRGEPCPEQERKRHAKQREHGRDRRAWRKLAAERKRLDGYRCTACGSTENLSVHLRADFAGDHERVTLEDVRTVCLSCHGAVDGARATGGRGAGVPREIGARPPTAPSRRKKVGESGFRKSDGEVLVA